MKKCFSFLLMIFMALAAHGQSSQLLTEQQAFEQELLKTYRNLKATGEEKRHLKELKSLPFFPFDAAFRVKALLDTSQSSGFQGMKTSKGLVAMYRQYGMLTFVVSGQTFSMPVYQGMSAGRDELFFPFTDETNGETTYGGGRYIDLHIPKGNEMVLDFNKAFNPYCAYSHHYSCEIPPKENQFPVKIEAGVKY